MTSYVTPKKGFPYIFYIALSSQSTGQFQSNPTLAAGDFKISKNGGALANLATLPSVTPAASKSVKVSLDSDETDTDNIAIIGSDAAGAEWDDIFVNIQTTVQQIDDLASQSTANAIKAKTDNLPADPADESNILAAIAGVQADTDNIQLRLPAALSGDGFMKADLLSINDELTNGNNATLSLKKLDVVSNDPLATVRFKNTGTGIGLDVVSDGGTAFDIYGGLYGLSIQGEQFNGLYVSGSADGLGSNEAIYIESLGENANGASIIGTGTGKSINVPEDIELSDGTLNLTAIEDTVWDAMLADHQDVGSMGETLGDAGSAGDPWNTMLPGAYGAGTAGKIVGDNLDAPISDVPTAAENSESLLKYDLSTITGEAARSVLNALRKLRNKVTRNSSTNNLEVYKENGTTVAYTQAISYDSDQEPFKTLGN